MCRKSRELYSQCVPTNDCNATAGSNGYNSPSETPGFLAPRLFACASSDVRPQSIPAHCLTVICDVRLFKVIQTDFTGIHRAIAAALLLICIRIICTPTSIEAERDLWWRIIRVFVSSCSIFTLTFTEGPNRCGCITLALLELIRLIFVHLIDTIDTQDCDQSANTRF